MRTIRKRLPLRHLALTSAVAILAGCAGTSRYLRSEPVTYFSGQQEIALPNTTSPYIRVHCVDDFAVSHEQPSFKPTNGPVGRECSYVSAEVNPFIAPTKPDDVRALIHTLIYYSDLNCSNFLHRAFANRSALDFSKSLTQDIATGASAVTAFSTPAASAILSGANLIVGKGVSDFDITYYLDKTFQAMQDAIAGERAKRLALIVAQTDGNEMASLAQLLSLIRSYDDACSIRDGLDQLATVAQKSNEVSQRGKAAVVADPSMTTYIANFATSAPNQTPPPKK